MTFKDISKIQRFIGAVEGAVCESDSKAADYLLELAVDVSDILDSEMEQICKERDSID